MLDDNEAFSREIYTVEDAEEALAVLIERGFASVDGDQITIPDEFIPKAAV